MIDLSIEERIITYYGIYNKKTKFFCHNRNNQIRIYGRYADAEKAMTTLKDLRDRKGLVIRTVSCVVERMEED